MTISTTHSRKAYTGNGSLDTYPFDFKVLAASDLKVHVAGLIQTLGIHYTVTGTLPGTGNIVFVAGSIPALNAAIIIEGDTPLTQATDLAAGEKFYESDIEAISDKVTILLQQLKNRSIRLPLGSSAAGPMDLPALAALGYLRANLTGTALEFVPLSGVPSTSADDIVGTFPDIVSIKPVVNIRAYGAHLDGVTDDSAAIQAAHDTLPATGGTILIPDSALGCLVSSQVTFTVPVLIQIGHIAITGPSAGYLFEFQANGSGILGAGPRASRMIATNGCDGVIHNNQALHCHYKGFDIDPNNAQNAKIFYHDGGWYINLENIEILKSNTHATTKGIYIKSTYTGVAGPTGSYGGAYVGKYVNIIAKNVTVDGDLAGPSNKVTTMTFINLDVANVILNNCDGMTFLQPVIQQTGGTCFALTNVAGLTALGGDFEGTGKVYEFLDANCRGIVSIGNSTQGFTAGEYITGYPALNSMFMDDYNSGFSDLNAGIQKIGQQMGDVLSWGGYASKHKAGMHYDGDHYCIGMNVRAIDASTGNLYDTSKMGLLVLLNTSGEFCLKVASAGANPRTFSKLIDMNTGYGGILSGVGSPEGVITANAGSIYMNAAGGGGVTLYVKEAGSGNTGWVAK